MPWCLRHQDLPNQSAHSFYIPKVGMYERVETSRLYNDWEQPKTKDSFKCAESCNPTEGTRNSSLFQSNWVASISYSPRSKYTHTLLRVLSESILSFVLFSMSLIYLRPINPQRCYLWGLIGTQKSFVKNEKTLTGDCTIFEECSNQMLLAFLKIDDVSQVSSLSIFHVVSSG